MSKQQEALRLALEALENHCDAYIGHSTQYYSAIEKAKEALAQPEQEPVACFVGMKGSAYDSPKTKRAYTYKEQPNNLVAYKLGKAWSATMLKNSGDEIDRGLGLLQQLEKEGFGVFDLGAEYTHPPVPTAQRKE